MGARWAADASLLLPRVAEAEFQQAAHMKGTTDASAVWKEFVNMFDFVGSVGQPPLAKRWGCLGVESIVPLCYASE